MKKSKLAQFIVLASLANVSYGYFENVTVNPRYWYADVERDFEFDKRDGNQDMYGITIGLSNDPQERSYLFTVFSGDYETDEGASKIKADRLDVEFLVRFPRDNYTLLYGFRYLNKDETFSYKNEEQKSYMLEIGASKSYNLNNSGNHLLFGNALIGGGYKDEEEKHSNATELNAERNGFDAFTDINIGYQYRATDSLSLIARYRYFNWIDTIKGPELSVSYTF